MPTIIETIAAWCAAPPPTSDTARRLAHHAIADTIGCLYAGRDDTSTSAVRRAFGVHAVGEAPLVTGSRQSASVSALINGTAAHALDYDDNFRPGMSHASAVIVPALLSVADRVGATGRAFVDAYLVALQAQDFVGSGVAGSHYTAGWHGTSTVGSIGTAAGVAKLLGLDAQGIAFALSLGVSMASGTKGQFGTPAKPFHAGMAARNAVEAAFLAEQGLRGRLDILECEQGFLEMFGGERPKGYDTEEIMGTREHTIETVGVMPKLHPCCGSTHMIVDAALDLMRNAPIDPENILSAQCHVGIANYRNLAYSEPRDEMQARFSMQYCLALAFRKKTLSLSDFTRSAVDKFSQGPLLSTISMTHYSAAEEEQAKTYLPHKLKITLSDGSVLEAERAVARGGLADPFSESERLTKIRDCLDGVKNAEAIMASLADFDMQKDLRFLDPLFHGVEVEGLRRSG
ncbi:MmgE/PrpD family protein [Agrobacterium rubi]|uniref:MmgE/PrpD family protein n=1 Tax=Agrobacterium rubi TaxID=28099 RepID=A0AAE7RE70_9HYPH|nr:MmgE/PrpD family protein [Agrobacterium rubi]MCL6652671.1 2-methylcitrate dehydratase [Agrobacterium rubi]NTE87458.1 MmgE/PrpD family protein [Agrobacterium rubi]NTF03312.1 MmgE/PrpD family protein [Agrobacterium rubi]NTF09770.1 MmgE/PrpD family protein [Agrobacterium rubi]NTF22053.1 MmgE/PrpD family protein [Agrobacterium rubi]